MNNIIFKYSKEKEMDSNPQSSTSREDLLEQINVFETNLKKYRELMSQEKDMFKTIKKSPDNFLEQVILLNNEAIRINAKLNDKETTKEIPKLKLDHYKIMFKHYESYFDIQTKTANTFIQLENSKKNKNSVLLTMRNKYLSTESSVENQPKI